MILKDHHILLGAEFAGKGFGLLGNALMFRLIPDNTIAFLVYLTSTAQFITSISRLGTDYSYQTTTKQIAYDKTLLFLTFNVSTSLITTIVFYSFFAPANAWGISSAQNSLGYVLQLLIPLSIFIESITDIPWEVIQKLEKFKQFALRNCILGFVKPLLLLAGFFAGGTLGMLIGFFVISVINLCLSFGFLQATWSSKTFRYLPVNKILAYLNDLQIGFFVWLTVLFSSFLGFPLLNKLQVVAEGSVDGLVGYRLSGILTQLILIIPAALTPLLLTKNSHLQSTASSNQASFYQRIRRCQINMIKVCLPLFIIFALSMPLIIQLIVGDQPSLDTPIMQTAYMVLLSSALISSLLQFQQQRPDQGKRLVQGTLIIVFSSILSYLIGAHFLVPKFYFLGFSLTILSFNCLGLILFLLRDSLSTLRLREYVLLVTALLGICTLPQAIPLLS